MLKLGDRIDYKGTTLEVVLDTDRLFGGWGRCSVCFGKGKTLQAFCSKYAEVELNTTTFTCQLHKIPAVLKVVEVNDEQRDG